MRFDRSKKIEEFWNKNVCGKHFVSARYPSKEFFSKYREFRSRKEHHLNYFIDWQMAHRKDVLEIGPGIGADGTRWAKYARSYTGIDLTNEAVVATSLHLRFLSLEGNVLKGNVESLPFENNRFDIVYAHGVLHHIPSIERALREIHRVLKSSGEIILMLYTKDSLNYWLRIQLYLRLRFLVELLKYYSGLRLAEPWSTHVRNYCNTGWSYFSWRNWFHRCTDGPDCEVANVYRKSEIIHLLTSASFTIKQMRKAHFPMGGKYPALERFLAKYIGFFQFVWATKL